MIPPRHAPPGHAPPRPGPRRPKQWGRSAAVAGSVFLILLGLLPSVLRAQDSKENADFKLAVSLYDDGMFDLAAQQFKQFVGAYPNTSQAIEARFYLGLVQMQLKQFDEARGTFQNFALSYVDHPRAAEAWLNVGHAFRAVGNDREAALAYERVKVFHPQSPLIPEALLRAGEMRRRTGERDAAKAAFRALIQGYPDSRQVIGARLAIGELYSEEGQLELAEEEARRVSRSDAPASVRAAALFAIARFNIDAGLFANAETTLAGLLARFPETEVVPHATLELGRLEILTGRAKQAAGRLTGLAARKQADDSLRAEALHHLGAAHRAAGQQVQAADAWEKLATGHPAHPLSGPARISAAEAALAGGKHRRALDLAAGVPAGSPGRARALLVAARAAAAARRTADAARHLKTLAAEFPADTALPGAFFELAAVYRSELSDCKNALRYYEQVLELDPFSPWADDALFGAASCRQTLGDDDDAAALYADLRLRYPASDRYDAAREAIDFLETHRIRNRDVGLGKLAQLLGGVLSEKPTPKLAYQLGEIYFEDLKDYGAAAKQFENALRGGLDAGETVTAAFLRARSYDLLSGIEPNAAGTAAELYAKFVEQFPDNDWTSDAAYFAFRLDASGNGYEQASRAGAAFLTAHPDSPHREAVTMTLGELALAASRPADAARMFRAVLASPSTRTDEALHGLARAEAMQDRPDSAALRWADVVRRGEHARMVALALPELARAAAAAGDFAAAAGHLRTLASEHPYAPAGEAAARELPAMLFRAGDYAGIVALLGGDTLSGTPPDARDGAGHGGRSTDDLLLLAQASDRSGAKTQAIAWYHRYLRAGGYVHRRASEAYYALGTMARQQGRAEAASAYFREASAKAPAAVLSADIAELLFASEQYAEAARQFRAIADSSKDPDERRRAGSRAIVATLRLDRVREADAMIAAFEKKHGRAKADRASFLYERGMAYYRVRDFPKAKDAFEKVADDFDDLPEAPWAKFYAAKVLEQTGDADGAFERYRDIAEDHPGSDVRPRALLSAANHHFNAERYEQAIGIYQQITSNPEAAGEILPYAMTNLISAYESVRLYENALQTTRDFILRFPNDPSIVDKKIRIGTLYTKIGYYDQAISQFQTLLPEAGSAAEAELRYDIGEAYYYKGEYQQAILEFLKVPYLSSGKGDVDWTATSFYMAGQSYEKMMKFDQAIAMYQQVIDRPGIDANFKAAARKEIERVRILNRSPN